MNRFAPVLLVIVGVACYEIGAAARWAKSEWEQTKQEMVDSKQRIDRLTDETVVTVQKFRDVLDGISNLFKEMENEVAVNRSRLDSSDVRNADKRPGVGCGINRAGGGGVESGGVAGGYEQSDSGARATSQVSPAMDFPRFD